MVSEERPTFELSLVGNSLVYTPTKRKLLLPYVMSPSKNLALKHYKMVDPNVPYIDTSKDTESFLADEIGRGRLTTESGLGFVVVSNGILNVARWDAKTPIMLKNQVYEFTNNDMRTSKKEDISEEGAFCAFELAIAGHEALQWRIFLGSQRTDGDKIEYLRSFFMGIID